MLNHSSKSLNQAKPLVCHECDLMVVIPTLTNGQKASCPRCGFVFTRFFDSSKNKLFALSTASIIFMLLTFFFPFLQLNSRGNGKTVYFMQSLQSMSDETYLGLVVFMLVTTVVIPAFALLAINYVLISSYLKTPLPYTKFVLRAIFSVLPWNMAEIFLLGILVSMVKIASLAQIQLGWSFYAFVLYIVTMAATRLYLDKYQMWHWISQHKKLGACP